MPIRRRLAAFSLAALATGTGLVLLARGWKRPERPALSVFEPHAGGCSWSKLDAVTKAQEAITRFPADCQNVQVSWSQDGERALVWFAPERAAAEDTMLYEVDVRAQKMRRLPIPEAGDPESYLLDKTGRILAFTLDQNITLTEESGAPLIEKDGKTYAPAPFPDGEDVLVHALALEEAGWKVIETRASRCCADGAPGTRLLALHAAARRDPAVSARQSGVLLTVPTVHAAVGETIVKAIEAKLPPALAGKADQLGPWLELTRPAQSPWPRRVVFHAVGGELARATGLAFLVEPDGRTVHGLPGMSFGPADVVQLQPLGGLLLVSEWGTGNQPHLYDMATGQLTWSSRTAAGTTFWPPKPPQN